MNDYHPRNNPVYEVCDVTPTANYVRSTHLTLEDALKVKKTGQIIIQAYRDFQTRKHFRREWK